MKIDVVIPKAKLLNIEKKASYDGSINWTELVLLQGTYCNTVNCDNRFSETLKVGQVYDFIMNVSEVPKAYKNGQGAYIETKFKVTGCLAD